MLRVLIDGRANLPGSRPARGTLGPSKKWHNELPLRRVLTLEKSTQMSLLSCVFMVLFCCKLSAPLAMRSQAEFKTLVKSSQPTALLVSWLEESRIAACRSPADYDEFRKRVIGAFPHSERVLIVGSGNWGYSLNPYKDFKPFDEDSDVDVAVVSMQHFTDYWDLLREFHRASFYQLSPDQRQRLRRNGENVYAGFVTPIWIPRARHMARFDFLRKLNQLSSSLVQDRPVKLMFFRNDIELVSYYLRGLTSAQSRL